MRYSIEQQDLISLKNEETGAGLWVDASCGGTVTRLVLDTANGPIDVLDPNPGERTSPSSQDRCYDPFFAGRMLWPFSDRIPAGIYQYADMKYQLPINDMESKDAIHGTLYHRAMEIETLHASDEEARLVCRKQLRPGDFEGYPFSVVLQLTYQLTRDGFHLSATGKNLDPRTAPMSFGWHPYFTLPDPDTLILESNTNEYVPVDTRLLPTGLPISASGSRYDFQPELPPATRRIRNRPLDIALTTQHRGPITTLLHSPEYTLQLHQSGAFAFQQLFTPPSRRSIAIEPLTSATNAFNHPQLGLLYLHTDENFRAHCQVSISMSSQHHH